LTTAALATDRVGRPRMRCARCGKRSKRARSGSWTRI
jgi:hypothetical protein